MAAQDDDVIDVTGDSAIDSRKRSRESSYELRRTSRKTEGRVLFADVLAQEREMERLTYENSRYHHSFSALPHAVETMGSPVKRIKHKRAEERRSARQQLRRNMSPRSPDGGLQLPLRGGVSLAVLEEAKEPAEGKRECARNEDAIVGAMLHSTAWRNVKCEAAPTNLLPDREGVRQPFFLEMDAALDEGDELLHRTCGVSTELVKPKPLSVMSGTLAEVR